MKQITKTQHRSQLLRDQLRATGTQLRACQAALKRLSTSSSSVLTQQDTPPRREAGEVQR